VIESINTAVSNAVAAGVVMVVAAGNSDADACFDSPSSARGAITVGATDEIDARASFSNFGACVNIFAPGKDIISAKTNTLSEGTSLSGTSMAAPHVAGVAALLLEEEPELSPIRVLDKMLTSATRNVVTNSGAGSPDRMLYTGDITGPAPVREIEPEPVPVLDPEPEPVPDPGPEPEPEPVPTPPTCSAKSESCTTDSDCCSKKCKGGGPKGKSCSSKKDDNEDDSDLIITTAMTESINLTDSNILSGVNPSGSGGPLPPRFIYPYVVWISFAVAIMLL
jgi:hypothetical protein